MNASLRFEARRQIGVGVQGNSVGAQLVHLCQSAIKGFGGLQRQAINQVHIDRFKTQTPCRRDQLKDLFCRLHTVHRFLNGGVKVLNAKAQSVEPQLGQHRQTFFIYRARVDFDGIFATRDKFEVLSQHRHQLAQLIIAHEGGRPAAKMQLTDRLTSP